jgi:hypothetical protein
VGSNARATANGSAAYGANASASGNNSVALGTGSVADRPNTVSMGSDGNERQITNVGDGTQATDAVNLRQLDKVGAMSAAIASLSPLTYDPDRKGQVSFGVGTYEGYQAMAVGFHYYAKESLLFNTGLATTDGNVMGNVSLTYKFGKSKATAEPTKDKLEVKLQILTKTMEAQQAEIKNLQDQQAQIRTLQEQIEALKKLLEAEDGQAK